MSFPEGMADNPDVEIILHSNYISQLGKDFCGAIQSAKANGDFAYETNLSSAKLGWKFRKIVKYLSCLK